MRIALSLVLFLVSIPAFAQGAATWNPSDKNASVTLSNGNNTASITVAANGVGGVRATTSKTSGKWYFRVQITAWPSTAPNAWSAGVGNSTWGLGTFLGSGGNNSVGCLANLLGAGHGCDTFENGAGAANGGTTSVFALNDWVVVAVDLTNGRMWVTRQTSGGVLQSADWSGGGNPSSGTNFVAMTTWPWSGGAFPAWSGGNTDAGTYTGVLDTTTVISDSTLTGFTVWSGSLLSSGSLLLLGVGK